MDKYKEYVGLSSEEASRQALWLVQEASRTGKTLGDLPERLIALRIIYSHGKD